MPKNADQEIDSSDEVGEMAFLKSKVIGSGDVVFDCGGNHGWTSILFSKWIGNTGKVVTFEPNIRNVKIIQKNLEINNINNVVVEFKAVGASQGKVKIFRKSNASVIPQDWITMLISGNLLYGLDEVELIALDRYVEQNQILPTAIKIDVEGYEIEVLKGAKNVLQTLPKLGIEIHTDILHEHNTSIKELLSFIDRNHYQCWLKPEGAKAPVEFDFQQEIKVRSHLFAIPKDKVTSI